MQRKSAHVLICQTYMLEESCCDPKEEDRIALGGICKDSRLPSNISTTLLIEGLSNGFIECTTNLLNHLLRNFCICFRCYSMKPQILLQFDTSMDPVWEKDFTSTVR
ncbi:hypothetical protein GIB67_020715 [Kingdonia uniflora]|uniref:Uncharacterized protein n=1 Tax=Kingdonia uniflora TaxID=39325 RepID=A0A7J7P1D4_9MAGN|nr:hypothetical protein GIB67_020715 [Kingdonia uniflora]